MTNDNKLLSTVKKVASKIQSLPKQLMRKGSIAANATSNGNMANSESDNLSATTAAENTEHSKVRIRLIPVWLRVILVLCLLMVVVVVGLMFGYSVLGDGNALDVLKWGTWQHIIDIMRGVE